jgi:hypothetical protein
MRRAEAVAEDVGFGSEEDLSPGAQATATDVIKANSKVRVQKGTPILLNCLLDG